MKTYSLSYIHFSGDVERKDEFVVQDLSVADAVVQVFALIEEQAPELMRGACIISCQEIPPGATPELTVEIAKWSPVHTPLGN